MENDHITTTNSNNEEYNDAKCVQPVLRSVNSTHQVEQEKDSPIRDRFLRELGVTLPDPLHCRLLNAYASTKASFARESIKCELACILLEVFDRVD